MDIDEYASVRSKLKQEYRQLEDKVKALQLECSLLKDKSSTEKLNMLNEFQVLISNPLLTWEEQNELYKTIIEYIDYKHDENNLTIEIKFK